MRRWELRQGWKRKLISPLAAAAAVIAGLLPAAVYAQSSAVVIMYHRFGESEYPSTNTTLEQLDAHIAELTSGPYSVLPLPEIVRRLKAGEALPDRTVGISIDDAYRSVYDEAWPRFKAAGLPFTVFASTAHLDGGAASHMDWEQLGEMLKGGASVGNHTVSHLHMPKADAARNAREIELSQQRFDKEFGLTPTLFAYPYGEASTAVIDTVRKAGFTAAFGQHSGVIGNTEGYYFLPRFSMNEKYGDLSRLKLAINALALPVTDIVPSDPLITTDNPPAMGFTINAAPKRLDQLACFLSHAGRAQVERLGTARIEVRIATPFPKGRTRLNCTMPGPNGRWHWYGRQFYRP